MVTEDSYVFDMIVFMVTMTIYYIYSTKWWKDGNKLIDKRLEDSGRVTGKDYFWFVCSKIPLVSIPFVILAFLYFYSKV